VQQQTRRGILLLLYRDGNLQGAVLRKGLPPVFSYSGSHVVAARGEGTAEFFFTRSISTQQPRVFLNVGVNRLHRTRAKLRPHRMAINAGVFDNQIVARLHQWNVRVELTQYVLFAVI